MEESIKKAAVLLEALPYIQSFRGKVVVIKFGGAIMDIQATLDMALRDIVFMECIGMKPVIVHGGGKKISRRLEEMGRKPHFLEGLRVTDLQTLKVVEDVLMKDVNPYLVDAINRFGGKAVGISGAEENTIIAAKHEMSHPDVDIGYVGDVRRVVGKNIEDLCEQDVVPVIAPLGRGIDRHTYNINADMVASAVAVFLGAEKLVCLTDAPGILADRDDPKSLLSTVKVKDMFDMIRDGAISEGMIPKAKACLMAVREGVHKTHIIDGRVNHSILLEIFTDKGVGTQIVSE